jgi:D-inositol-3-phosphate glycosyltransferase
LISFIWEPGLRLPAGTGGSENYTIGHVRELNRRGVPAQVVTVGLGTADGRDEFSGIPFRSLMTVADVSDLEGTIVFVTEFPVVATKSPAYQILHVPPPLREHLQGAAIARTRDRGLIATSRFAAELWAEFLEVDVATIRVVYPFAEPCFGAQARTATDAEEIRILYAGRLSPEKGIYTFLAMLHNDMIDRDVRLTFTATTAGADKPQGAIIRDLLEAHPGVRLVPACKTPASMAALMADHDIVVMPSNSQYWHETFGIVSIEAQHAGCRVVASDDGGLPETDCGAVTLVVPDNAEALALGIYEAILRGPISSRARRVGATRFTVRESVDELLAVLTGPRPFTPAAIIRELEAVALLPLEVRDPPTPTTIAVSATGELGRPA